MKEQFEAEGRGKDGALSFGGDAGFDGIVPEGFDGHLPHQAEILRGMGVLHLAIILAKSDIQAHNGSGSPRPNDPG